MSHGQRLLRQLVRHLIELAGHSEIVAELQDAFMVLHPRPDHSPPPAKDASVQIAEARDRQIGAGTPRRCAHRVGTAEGDIAPKSAGQGWNPATQDQGVVPTSPSARRAADLGGWDARSNGMSMSRGGPVDAGRSP
jgi:hypothetical protein